MPRSSCATLRTRRAAPAAASGGNKCVLAWLDPGREPDRQARAGLDDAGNDVVAERIRGTVLDRLCPVRQLVVAKREDRLFERRIGLAEALRLILVMLVDDLLDRDRAGHRRCLAEQRRRHAER